MAGFGNVALAGAFGAVGGAGQGVEQNAEVELKDQILALRDKRLSDLRSQEYKDQLAAQVAAAPQRIAAETPGLVDRVRQEGQVKNELERDATRVVPAGSTVVYGAPASAAAPPSDDGSAVQKDILAAATGQDGSAGPASPPAAASSQPQTFTAPTKLSPGQEDYYKAHADEAKALTARYQAEADAISKGERYRGQYQSPKFTKDQDGNLVDENTGAYRVKVPTRTIKPAVTHFFAPDEPAQVVPEHYQWFDANDRPLAGGIASLYKKSAGGGAPASGSATPATATAASESAGPAPDATPTPSDKARPLAPPQVGDVVQGYRYRGGDANDRRNWEPLKKRQAPLPTPPSSTVALVPVRAELDAQSANPGGEGIAQNVSSAGTGSLPAPPSGASAAPSPPGGPASDPASRAVTAAPIKPAGIIDRTRQQQDQAMELLFESEDREIQAGRRADYSPEVKAWFQAAQDERRRQFDAADADLLRREQARMLSRPIL